MPKLLEVKVGQIWKDRDPRANRLVVVQGVFRDKVRLQTCGPDGTPLPKMPQTHSLITRFYKGGRSTGFSLIKDVSP
jgi:hypothetical protein